MKALRLLLALSFALLASFALSAPVIGTQPVNVTVTAGQPASFSVVATGTGTLTYQWQRNGFTIAGATSPAFTGISSASRTDADYYNVIVTDSADSANPEVSALARLSVAPTSYPGFVVPDPAWNIMSEYVGGSGNAIAPIPSNATVAPGGYYVGGSFVSANGTSQQMLYRVKADGTFDPSFTPPTLDNAVFALGVQSDGKVIVGGVFFRVGGFLGRDFLIRLNTDGSLDTSFKAAVTSSTIFAILVQPADDRIVIGGNFTTVNGTGGVNRIARLNANGTTDPTFSSGAGFNGTVNALALQANGSIVAGGSFTSFNGTTNINRIARLSALGALDSTLNVGTTATAGADSTVSALAIQASDGSILLGGSFLNFNGNAAVRLARISTLGVFDAGFTTALGVGGFNGTVTAITLQGDTPSTVGQALVGGFFSAAAPVNRTSFCRLLSTGAPDTTITTPVPNSGLSAIALQADGHVLLGGGFTNFGGTSPRHSSARLNSDATLTLDASWIPTRNSINSVAAVLPLSGGKVIVAGLFSLIRGNAVSSNLARFNSDGTYDPSFNANGAVTNIAILRGGSGYTTAPTVVFTGGTGGSGAAATATVANGAVTGLLITNAGSGYTTAPIVSFTGSGTGALASANINGLGTNNVITAAALLPDGRIAIGGSFTSYNGTTRNRIAIINANGTLDTSFNPSGTNSGVNNTVYTISVLPGGRLFVGGNFTNANNAALNRVAIFKLDGTLDTSFAPTTGADNQVFASVVQPDGNIIIGGQFLNYNGTARADIARIKQDGTLDTAFLATGTGFNAQVNTLTLLFTPVANIGQIVVGGNFSTFNGVAATGTARLSSTGTLDTTFVSQSFTAYGVLAQEDGAVLARSGNGFGGPSSVGLIKLSGTTGARVTTFAIGGVSIANTNFAPLAMRDNGQLFTSSNLTGLVGTQPAPASAIATPPQTQVAVVGGSATFTVTAAGPLPATYQWFFNGTALFGATASNYTVFNAQLANVGSYTVAVTTESGTNTSAPALLTGPNPPVVQPLANLSVTSGQPANFTVSATGTGTLTYQWRRNGLAIPTATSSSYLIGSAFLSDADTYDVLVIDGLAVVTSTPARLGVSPAANPVGVQFDPAFDLQLENALGGTANVVTPYGTTGQFLVGGDFIRANDNTVRRLARFNSDGSLDSTFLPPLNFTVNAVLVLPDSKILVGGSFTSMNGVPASRFVRLNANGTLDATFNPGGTGATGGVLAIVRQSDGKIIIGGGFTTYNGATANRIARLNSDGSLDTSFLIGSTQGVNNQVNALALDPLTGKVVLGGFFTTHSVTSVSLNRIARFNTNGTNDTTFAIGTGFNSNVNALGFDATSNVLVGGAFTSYGAATNVNRLVRLTDTGAIDASFVIGTGTTAGTNNTVTSLAYDGANTRWLVGGSFTSYNNSTATFNRLLRVSSGGALDTAFLPNVNNTVNSIFVRSTDAAVVLGGFFNNVGNQVTPTIRMIARVTAVAGALDTTLVAPTFRAPGNVNAMLALPAGKVLIAGSFTHSGATAVGSVARLNANLSVDPTFNVSGLGANGTVTSAVLQGDGRMVIGGAFTTFNGTTMNRLARLNTDGTLDPTFAIGSGGPNSTVNTLVALPGGRLLVGGNFATFNGVARAGVVGLNADATLDFTLNAGSTAFNVFALAAQPDGKIVAGGSFTSVNGVAKNNLVRLNADGSLDAGFLSGNGPGSQVRALVLQPNGKIVVGGDFFTYNGTSTTRIIQLNSDGTLDPAFAVGTNLSSNVDAITRFEDGKLLVIIQTAATSGLPSTGILARLKADGTLDPTFGHLSGTAANPFINLPAAQTLVLDDGTMLMGSYSFTLFNQDRFGLVRLRAVSAPTIATQPQNVVALAGQNASFTVAPVDVDLTTTYQWFKNGTFLPGATNSTLALTNVQLADAGAYTVTITNGLGSVTSLPALLSGANPLPTIMAQPIAASGTAGGSTSLTVAATGTGPLAYQWRKFGVPLAGAISATLNLAALGLDAAGYYDVLVSDGLSTRVSASTSLTVAPSAYAGALRPRASFEPRVEFSSAIFAYAPLADGRFYAGGGFTTIDGVAIPGIARFLANGTVDSTFNPVVITGTIFAIAVQADDKVVIGGSFGYAGGQNSFRLGRLNANGSVDTTFTLGSGMSGGNVNALAIQPADQKILVGGAFTSINSTVANRVVRLNPDGSPDATFNTGTGFDGTVNALLVQPDGTVVVGGAFLNFNGAVATRIARLTPIGALDATFISGTGFDNSVNALALQSSDNKIVVGGAFTTYAGASSVGLARLGSTGTRDTALLLGTGFTGGTVSALAVQSDGKIAVGGQFTGYNGTAVARLTRLDGTTGALDTALNTTIGTSGVNAIVRALAVQPTTNQLLAGGSFNLIGTTPRFALARFNLDGTLDPLDRSLREPGFVNAIVPVAGGKIVVGGLFSHVGGVPVGANLTRLDSAGVVDATFNVGTGPNNLVRSIVQQGDGKLVLGGGFTNYNGVVANRVTRITADGTLDTAFNTAVGVGANNTVNVLALQADGRIALGGNFTSINSVAANRIARLATSGALDVPFATANGTGFNNNVSALVAHPDGRLSAGGAFTIFNSLVARNLTRLLPDGGVDPLFITGTGMALSSSQTGTSGVSALLLQANGNLVAGGFFGSYDNATAGCIVSLLPNGAVDTSFALGSGFSNSVSALLLQPDGGIVVAGSFTSINTQRRGGLARLSPSGALDLSFGAPFAVGIPSNTINALTYLADGSLLLGQPGRQDFVDRIAGGLTLLENAPAPAILNPPFGGALIAGSTTNVLTVVAAGTPPLSYQWKRNGANLAADNLRFSGTTTNVLSFLNAQPADAGAYTVTITDATTTTITTAPVVIVVPAAAPIFTGNIAHPFGPTIQAGTATYLSIPVLGSAPTSVAWTKNGAPVAGGFYASGLLHLPLTPARPADAGVYQVTVTNALGTATSAATRFWVSEAAGWTPHNPLPSPQGLLSLYVDNGQFVAGGVRGARLASTDGITWSQLPALSQNNVFNVFQGNGRRVLVGSLGFIAISTDGVTWRTSALPTFAPVQGSAFGAGLFVVSTTYTDAPDGLAKIYTSPDGEVWTERYSTQTTALNSLTFGNGTFALFTGDQVLRSADGIAWTSHPAPASASFIRFANGQFFLASSSFGDFHVSTDAIAWTTRAYGSTGARDITHANNQYILTGDNGLLLTSPDALNWTRRATNTNNALRSAAFNNGTWVVLSRDSVFPATILTSTDSGATWANRTTSVTFNNLNAVATDGSSSLISVGGAGTIVRSTNGTTFTTVSSGVTDNLASVAFGAANYIAVGAGGRILTSPTGTTWTTVTSGTTAALEDAVFLNGQFLVSGSSGLLLRSADGATWTSATLATGGFNLQGIAYGAGRYVTATRGGVILTSIDAASWTAATSGTTADLNGVAYGNGKFLVTSATVVLSSTDGLTWTSSPAPEIPGWDSGTLFINGQFYASAGRNSLITSLDGITWSGHHLGTNYSDLNGPTAFQGRLYATGDAGLIISAAAPVINTSPTAAVVRSGGTLTLLVTASGSYPLTYQWRKGTIPIDGATGPFYSKHGFAAGDVGSYDVLVTNIAGSVASAAAAVTLAPAIGTLASDPAFTRPDFKQDVMAGRVTVDSLGRVYATWTNGNIISGIGTQLRGAVIRLAADGTVDPTFNMGSALVDAWPVVLQSDGKILVGGVASNESAETGFALPRVFRFNPDGTRDFSYNSPHFAAVPRFMTMQPDGRLLVVPSSNLTANGGIPVMARLNPDGSLDSTFAQPTLSANSSIFLPPVVDPSGHIYVGGIFTTINTVSRPALARLLPNGTVDTGFVPAGFTVGGGTQIRGLALQTQGANAGKLLVAGGPLNVASVNRPVIRLLSTGALDPTFTLVTQADAGMSVRPRLLNTLGDDRFYIVGSTVTRFLSDGAVDPSYTKPAFSTDFFWMDTMADGRVVLPPELGSTVNGTAAPALVRLTATGAVDPAFAPGIINREIYPGRFAMLSDSKLLTWGQFDRANNTARPGIARLNLNGSLDTGFAVTGVPNLRYVAFAEVGSDGRILAGTRTGTNPTALTSGVVRLQPDGSVDPSFTLDATLAGRTSGMEFRLLPDNKVSVWSLSFQGLVSDNNFFQRLTAGGALDPSFNLTGFGGTFGSVYRGATGAITSITLGSARVLAHDSLGRLYASSTTGSYPANATSLGFTFYRTNPDGLLDSTFTAPVVSWPTTVSFPTITDSQTNGGTAGQVSAVVVSGTPFAGAVPVSGGKLLVYGLFTTLGGQPAPGLARLTNTGAVDTTFNIGTGAQLRYQASRTAQVEGVTVAADGKIWVTGAFDTFGGIQAPGIVRLNADGSVDTNFATDIFYRTYLGGITQVGFAPNGTVYVSGTFSRGGDAFPSAFHALVNSETPVISTQPVASQSLLAGVTANFSVTATGANLTYQWRKNGADIPGANGATYSINPVAVTAAGLYDVVIANGAGSVASAGSLLNVEPAVISGSRLLNLSSLGAVGLGEHSFLASFTIEGTAAKSVLVRAVGPTLATFGVSGTLGDPILTLHDATGAQIATNNDWGGGAPLTAAFSAVGAFALSANSKDAALLISLAPGTYTARVTGAVASSGMALVEVYDANDTQRFAYLSVRSTITAGATATTGFAIGGSGATGTKTVLIRTLGSSLVPALGALANTTLKVFAGSTEIANNDDWGTNPNLADLATATAAAGAMPLAGNDAAVLLTLAPGNYTVRASGFGGAAGFVLTEIHIIDSFRAATFAPALLAPLHNQALSSGAPIYLHAPVVGKPTAVSYVWKLGGAIVTSGVPVADSPGALYLPFALASDSGLYTVEMTNAAGTTVSAAATIAVTPPVGYSATHALFGPGYVAGGTVTITNTLSYAAASASLGWSVTLPTGWSYVSSAGDAGETRPLVGSTGTVSWAWTVVPLNSVTFTYTVNVPAGETATRALTAIAIARPGGNPVTFIANPNPLSVARVGPHSADTNRDFRLNLIELTRVIELYNTRITTVRTGRYLVQAGTEDGFTPDGVTPDAATVTLTSYHSADVNRDGKLSIPELTRVILLYNTHAATVRTGAYHPDLLGEDAYNPGP